MNATGGQFGNLIQAAAFGGHETMVSWLIDLGADLHARGRYGSPLRAASLGGHNAVVQLLLDHGARMDTEEDNALQAAALNGHFVTSKLLVGRLEEACNWSACHESALEAASFKGHIEIVQFLLQNRLRRLREFNELDDFHFLLQNRPRRSREFDEFDGGKAMLAAVITGQESVVNYLIKEIPQLREIGRIPQFRVSCRALLRPPEELDLLPPKPRATPSSDSSSSIKGGGADVACIRPCDTTKVPSDWDSLTNLADMQENIAIPATHTPLGQEYILRIAVGQGYKRMVEHLKACGFEGDEIGNRNVDFLLRRGTILGKALLFAVRDGKVDVVRLLLAYWPEAELDCFIDPVELQGQYQWVLYPVYPDELFGRYRMDLPTSRRNLSNWSPLAIAVEWGHDEIVLALLRHKAKSRHPGLGLSMLVAARNGFEGTIRVFMDYGRATKSSMDSAIISDFLLEQSFREASANGHLHIVKALLEQFSLYEEQSRYIHIAMCEARMHGHNEILADLRALTPPLDSRHLLGDELIAMASTKPNRGSITPDLKTLLDQLSSKRVDSKLCAIFKIKALTPYLERLLDRLSSKRVDSKLCTIFKVKALKGALKAGQYEAARFLLEKDESCRILETETDILHFAIRTMWINDFSDGRDSNYKGPLKHRDLLDVFIKHGASTKSLDSLGNTPLFYACSNPIPGVFDMLIESKVSPWTEHALRLSDSLESTISRQEVGDSNKLNLLNVALQSRIKHEDVSNLLKTAPYRFERKGSRVVYSEWEKIILCLMHLGLPFDPGDPSLVSFLHDAIKLGKVEIVDLLLRRGTKVVNIPLCQNVEIVKLLIDYGTTIHLPLEKMMKWHEEAIETYNVPLLELLIAQSGLLLPNPLSHLGIPSHKGDQHLGMIRFLLKYYNCDINATFRSHQWFLDVAYDTNILLEARKDLGEDTIKFLLEHGADPDGPDLADSILAALFRLGRSSSAYQQLTIAVVRLLLDHGAEINGSKKSPTEAEKYPRTLQPPLICAIKEKDLSMVEFLIANGADVNATSGPETPLHLARREGHGEIAEHLVRHGAIDRYEEGEMGRAVLERPGLTPVTTESLRGHDKLRFP